MTRDNSSVEFTDAGWKFVSAGRDDLPKENPTMASVPKCPRCGRRGKPQGVSGDMFWCDHCSGMYDNEPDEGGDYHADPSRRMERSEQKAIRARRGPR